MSTALIEVPVVPSPWKMYRAMVGIGLLCGLLIVSVYEFTRPIIAQNKAEALQKAIFRVLPAARSSRGFRVLDDGTFEPFAPQVQAVAGERVVYAGYGSGNELVGLAIEAGSMGYADIIHVLYGYSFGEEAIVGFWVLESKETPGLGDKIMLDEEFQNNFKSLDVALGADGRALAHAIEFTASGTKASPWQIDGITGATISSRAVAKGIAESAAEWVPLVHSARATFQAGATP